MDETIDNQQVKPEELAWLAGFWDGEGTITVFHTKRKNGKDRYNASLVVVNTHEETISHILKLLDRLGIKMHLLKRQSKNKKHAVSYQLTTRNMLYIQKLLPLLIPYLVCKKAQAELTLRFVNSRLESNTDTGGWGHWTPYEYDEVELSKQLKVLNQTGKPSETIRQTS